MLNSKTLKMITLILVNLVIQKKINKESAVTMIKAMSEEYCKWNPASDETYLLRLFESKLNKVNVK